MGSYQNFEKVHKAGPRGKKSSSFDGSREGGGQLFHYQKWCKS